MLAQLPYVEILPITAEIKTEKDRIAKIPLTLEYAARVCHASTEKMTGSIPDAENFVRGIIRHKHFPVLEHEIISVEITCDRATSHQLVRHRIASYCQESQRHCDYEKRLPIVLPLELCNFHWATRPQCYNATPTHLSETHSGFDRFIGFCLAAQKEYAFYREIGWKKESARRILPNATATKVYSTFNIAQWRHVFYERVLNKAAEAEIRFALDKVFRVLLQVLPCCFEDMAPEAQQLGWSTINRKNSQDNA